ncbi:phosphatidylserine decarboxylase [Candidatus Arsenophonus triatominarum]|uniref:phosphatidylserine decarboxylase n=1 Tax=Candidatus Arsenophonus triatominarum TaxID=57911 RepID=UPI003CCC3AD9
MAVGMAEVSTCEITVYEGQHITKSQKIGLFHFGGSTSEFRTNLIWVYNNPPLLSCSAIAFLITCQFC